MSMAVYEWWAELTRTKAVLKSAYTRFGAQCAMTSGTSTMLVLCADSLVAQQMTHVSLVLYVLEAYVCVLV